MAAYTLTTGNGNSALYADIEQDCDSLTLRYCNGPSRKTHLRGVSNIGIKKSTTSALFPYPASLSIRSNDALFGIAMRNPFASYVELQMLLGAHSSHSLGQNHVLLFWRSTVC